MRLWRWGLVGLVGTLGACAHTSTATNPTAGEVTAEQTDTQKALQHASDAQAKADKAQQDATAAEQKVLDDQKQLALDESSAQTKARDARDKANWLQHLQGEVGGAGQGLSGSQSANAFDQKRLDKAQKDAEDAKGAAEDAQNKVSDAQEKLQEDRAQAQQLRQKAIYEQQQAANVAQQAAQRAQQHQRQAAQAMQQEGQQARRAAPTVSGSIATISGNELIVVPTGKSTPLHLQAGQNTVITLDGQPAGLQQLPPGAQVRASYAPGQNGIPVARRIDVRSNGLPMNGQQQNSNGNQNQNQNGNDQGANQP